MRSATLAILVFVVMAVNSSSLSSNMLLISTRNTESKKMHEAFHKEMPQKVMNSIVNNELTTQLFSFKNVNGSATPITNSELATTELSPSATGYTSKFTLPTLKLEYFQKGSLTGFTQMDNSITFNEDGITYMIAEIQPTKLIYKLSEGDIAKSSNGEIINVGTDRVLFILKDNMYDYVANYEIVSSPYAIYSDFLEFNCFYDSITGLYNINIKALNSDSILVKFETPTGTRTIITESNSSVITEQQIEVKLNRNTLIPKETKEIQILAESLPVVILKNKILQSVSYTFRTNNIDVPKLYYFHKF